jgi:signal transduction histidine kinase
MTARFSFRRSGLLYGFVAGLIVSAVFLVLSWVLPPLFTSDYYQRSLKSLRQQAESIKREFALLEWGLQRKKGTLLASSFPLEKDKIFELFQKMKLRPEVEGAAYYDQNGDLAVWLGNAIDFRPDVSGPAFVVQSKASVYLVSAQRIRRTETIVVFRLLAFQPQPKAAYLEDYQFLSADLQKNCRLDYSDYRDDVSGFEKFFGSHRDEYIGRPRLENEIQTIFFPLRNDRREIVATVNLRSPSVLASQYHNREWMTLIAGLALVLSLALLVIHLARTRLFTRPVRVVPVLILMAALAGLRLILLPIGRLEKIQSLPIFSPSAASFFSYGDLTQSPADIFLTSLFLFLIIGGLAVAARRMFEDSGRRLPPAAGAVAALFACGAVVFLIAGYQGIVSRLIFNSNVNLLRFAPDLSFLLLQLSLAFLFFTLALLIFLAFRTVTRFFPRLPQALPFLLATLAAAYFALKGSRPPPVLVVTGLLLAVLFFLAYRPAWLRRTEVFVAVLAAAALFNSAQIHLDSGARLHSLVEDFLHNTITSQENWADFLIRQSVPEVDKRKPAILSFLKNPDQSPIARSIWENTLVARFNWYSTLQIVNPQGEILSRFSLNIAQLYQPEIELPTSLTWRIMRLDVPSLGKVREFVFGYKDWYADDRYLGRVLFSLAVDPEMLPFLYSANPYFELLKVSTLPSLYQQKFGFAIYDAAGKLIFNPDRTSSGISADRLALVNRASDGVWLTFKDKETSYDAFYFPNNRRIYSLFLPRKNVMGLSVEVLKLLVFYLALALLVLLLVPALRGGKKPSRLLWSFASRVYAVFIAITVLSLLLFSFFSHSFFSRVFAQRFIEKAEVHANFARNVMQDFIFLQQEERATLIAPTDDIVLWISSAIANDVNLYREGRLASSSRREFYDWGLLPELADGEIYFRLSYENKPFYTLRQRIGRYSYQLLAIPYAIHETRYLISLPFPFEEQEISQATQELVEFLVFISVFLVAVVLILARAMERMIITPVNKLVAGTREVGLGNLDISIEHGSRDEMRTLVDGFNAMIKELKRHQQEIAELSKKIVWAEMAQKIAHEIKNPLTPIQLSAEHLLRVYEDRRGDFSKALKESTSYIIGEVANLRRIAQEFLELSKVSSLKKEVFDLKAVVHEIISPYQKMLSERIRFREIYEGKDFRLQADPAKIKIAFRNLFVNAVEAIPGRGEIEVRLVAEDGRLLLTVRDTGVGMEKEVVERIFDTYFSTKDAGTGLGLPIARKIIEDHGGAIRAESSPGQGTTVTISLPKNIVD